MQCIIYRHCNDKVDCSTITVNVLLMSNSHEAMISPYMVVDAIMTSNYDPTVDVIIPLVVALIGAHFTNQNKGVYDIMTRHTESADVCLLVLNRTAKWLQISL